MQAWITRDPIDTQHVLGLVGSPSDGAAVLFLGTVRDHNDDRPVRAVTYDAYVEMATPILETIAAEASTQAGSDRLAVVHRIGELRVGEISVAIAVSTSHRAESFDAARYIIEQIKQRLPVWKHEHYVEGEPRWLAGATPPAGG